MKKPNFFIIGAPKCGTTSLAAWLREHPHIFMCEPKEPWFFNTDMRKPFKLSRSMYEQLFEEATSKHFAVGEASTTYLRSRCAMQNILAYAPEAKIVVCLRNPAQMVVSWHSQLLSVGVETERDFRKAWHLQKHRRAGHKIPRLCYEPSDLMYADVCSLGKQVRRLLGLIPHDRVHFIVLDDMRDMPVRVYCELLEFLGVHNEGRTQFPALNRAKKIPKWLAVLSNMTFIIKGRLRIHSGLGILVGLNNVLARNRANSVSTSMHNELVDYFEPDVRILESILDRDLSHWRRRR